MKKSALRAIAAAFALTLTLSAASCITETTRRVECEWDGTTYKNT